MRMQDQFTADTVYRFLTSNNFQFLNLLFSVTAALLTEHQLLILSHINNVYVLLGSRLPNLST